MRRFLTIAMLVLALLAANACAKTQLSNDYFPNPTEDSWDDARIAFNDNIAWARAHLKSYFPRRFFYAFYDTILDDDSYVNAQIWNKDVVWRHEFYNYHLTDDRDFLTTALGMEEFELVWVEGDDCVNPEEGVPCYRYEDNFEGAYSGLLFYMDGDSLFVDTLRTYNQTTKIRTVFHFYEQYSSIPNVMEMTILVSEAGEPGYELMSHTTLIRGVSEESYQCVSCDPDDPEEGYLRYFRSEFNDLEDRDFDDGTIGRYLEIAIGHDFMNGEIYDDDTGEYYRFSKTETGLWPWEYERYVRNTNIVRYSGHSSFQVNLAEVPGWDNIRKVEDEIGAYRLYDGDVLLSGDERIELEFRIGEYPFFHYYHGDEATWIPDDILDLGVIGLSAPYSRAYFDERFAAGAELYAQAFAEMGFDVSYEENYATFTGKLMTSVFPT